MTPQIEAHLTAYGKMKKKDIIINNFLGGLAWGLGSVIGATLVVAILVGFLKSINFVPIIGDFTHQVMQDVNSRDQLSR